MSGAFASPNTSDSELMTGLLALMKTNEELAVIEMQKIRDSVLSARAYMENLTVVFREVRTLQSALAALEAAPLKSWRLYRPRKRTSRPTAVAVLLSTKTHFSGEIVPAVFADFLRHIHAHQGDIIIAGSLGRDWFSEIEPGRTFEYIELPTGGLPAAESGKLARKLTGYDEVQIFHGRFVNLVQQVATHTPLAKNPLLLKSAAAASRKSSEEIEQFLFEPSLSKVAQFFDEQVAGALVSQVLNESELALLGSRITALERSQQVIQTQLAAAERLARLARRSENSRRQAERLAGMRLW